MNLRNIMILWAILGGGLAGNVNSGNAAVIGHAFVSGQGVLSSSGTPGHLFQHQGLYSAAIATPASFNLNVQLIYGPGETSSEIVVSSNKPLIITPFSFTGFGSQSMHQINIPSAVSSVTKMLLTIVSSGVALPGKFKNKLDILVLVSPPKPTIAPSISTPTNGLIFSEQNIIVQNAVKLVATKSTAADRVRVQLTRGNTNGQVVSSKSSWQDGCNQNTCRVDYSLFNVGSSGSHENRFGQYSWKAQQCNPAGCGPWTGSASFTIEPQEGLSARDAQPAGGGRKSTSSSRRSRAAEIMKEKMKKEMK